MGEPFRFKIASFDTDVPSGPVEESEFPAGQEIAEELRDVLKAEGYEIDEFDLLSNYAWWISFKVNKSRVDIELFGACEDWSWMVFVRSSLGCLMFFRTKPDDLISAYHAVDFALRRVSLIRNVRWHEPGAELAELGESRDLPE